MSIKCFEVLVENVSSTQIFFLAIKCVISYFTMSSALIQNIKPQLILISEKRHFNYILSNQDVATLSRKMPLKCIHLFGVCFYGKQLSTLGPNRDFLADHLF